MSPASLVFTPANALTPQTVTVTGVDDAIVDGNQAYTIVTAPAVSADPAYSGLNRWTCPSPTRTTTSWSCP